MKIVYLCDWLPPDFGAVGQYSLQYARQYAFDHGWEVVLIGLSSAGTACHEEALGRGRLTVIKVWAPTYNRARWRQRLFWTLRTNLRLLAAALRHVRGCQQILFTGSPPFLLHFIVPCNLLLHKRLVYRITDFYPECIMAALERRPLPLRLAYWWTCVLRRRVDQFQVSGDDQGRRLQDIGVPPERIVLKRDPPPVRVTGEERPLAPPAEIADYAILLYSGNYGVAHDVDTFLEGYRAHHHRGSARVALWLNAVGANADRVEAACRESGLPVARTKPLPLARLPRLLVTPAAHLITLRREFTGFVMPSKVYGCIASGRAVLYIGDTTSDVHDLCRRAGTVPLYRQVDPGDQESVARALEEIASFSARAAVSLPPGREPAPSPGGSSGSEHLTS